MKRLKEIGKVAIATVTAVALFGGLLWGVNIRTLHAAAEGETYLPQTVEEVSIPDPPVPEETQALSFSLTNVTEESIVISSLALSMEEAAQVGAQYILDVFGVCIDGMYIEFQFSNWDHMTRSVWFGVVSDVYRNSLFLNQRTNELHDEIMARIDAGECPETVRLDWQNMLEKYQYIPGCFYFFIDAVSGERIDIWRNSTANRGWTRENSAIIEAYVERELGGNWGHLFSQEADPAIIEEFSLIAAKYAQRHFNNSTVVDVEFSGESTSLTVDENNTVVRLIQLNFQVTDDTGRIATVIVCQNSRTLASIFTMSNDMIPIEIEVIGNWEIYEYVLDDGSTAFRRVLIEEATEEDENIRIRRERGQATD